ncbi:MAG: hypothetical protein ACRCYR_20830 [Phycicoccus sp.]
MTTATGTRPRTRTAATRGLMLHLRSRHWATAVPTAVALVTALWVITHLSTDELTAPPVVAMLAVTLGVLALATTLGTPDDALDRAAARPWPPRRLAQVLVLGAIALALPALALPTTTDFAPAAFLLRDAAGLTGLFTLGAIVLGPGRAWVVVLTWCAPVAVFGPMYLGNPDRTVVILTWMIQPAGQATAALAAAAVATTGVLAYALVGPPRRPASEPSDD